MTRPLRPLQQLLCSGPSHTCLPAPLPPLRVTRSLVRCRQSATLLQQLLLDFALKTRRWSGTSGVSRLLRGLRESEHQRAAAAAEGKAQQELQANGK